jgi:hypothetical protein
MRGLAAISAVLACVAASVQPAAAATMRIPAAPVSGPVVAGGEAVWAVARSDEGFDLIAAPSGGPYRVVQRFPSYRDPVGHDVYLVPQLSAAGDRLGLAIDAEPIQFDRYDQDLQPAGADVLIGTAGAPLQSVLQCRPGLPVVTSAAIMQDGIVLPGPDCDAARAGGVALRGDGGDVRPLTPSGSRLRSAGRFAGWIVNGNEVVVYDTAAAAVAYRITGLSTIADWDLQADGKVVLAVTSTPDGRATLRWYSPADPSPHELPVASALSWDVHMSGDRIAYLRGPGYVGYWYYGELGVTDLAGNAHTVANRAIGVAASHPAFSFDGSTATWAAPACSGATLQSASVDAVAGDGPRPRCPLTFRRAPRMVGTGAIRVALRCSGFVLPHCGGSDVKLEATKQHVRLGSDEARFCDRAADVLLTRRGTALVRKLKTLRVRATASTIDSGGKREVRTTTFTLHTRDKVKHRFACEDE